MRTLTRRVAETPRYRRVASVGLLAAGGFLVLIASFLTLPLAAGAPVNTTSAANGISQSTRELFYFVTVAGYVALISGATLAASAIVASVRCALGFPRLVTALCAAILVGMGVRIFAANLGSPFYPFHEGEWLFPYRNHFPFIHGYLINEWPLRLVHGLGMADNEVAATRSVRFAIGLASYAVVPAIFLASAAAANAPARRSAFVLVATAVFLILQGVGFVLAPPDLGLIYLPVRNLPVLLVLWSAIALVRAPDALHSHAIVLGVVGLLATLLNITAFFLWLGTAVLLCGWVWLVAGGVRPAVRVAIGALVGLLVAAAVAEALTRGAVTGSVHSIVFLAGVGRDTFGDQIYWYINRGPLGHLMALVIGVQAPLFLIAAGLVWIIGRSVTAADRGWIASEAPALLILAATAMSMVLVTGAVGATHPGGLLIATVAAGSALRLWHGPDRSGTRAAIATDAASSRAPAGAFTIGVAAVGGALFLAGHGVDTLRELRRRSTAVQAASPDDSGASAIGALYEARHVRCVASLTSEGGLFHRTHAGSCFAQRFPIYDTRPQSQRRMVAELRDKNPPLVHVASAELDHHYPPQAHVPLLYGFVMRHYRPGPIVGGHWFWTPPAGEVVPTANNLPPARVVQVLRVPRLPDELVVDAPLPRGIAADPGHVGLLIFAPGARWPSVAAVGTVTDGRVRATIRPSREIMRAGGSVRIVSAGMPGVEIARIVP